MAIEKPRTEIEENAAILQNFLIQSQTLAGADPDDPDLRDAIDFLIQNYDSDSTSPLTLDELRTADLMRQRSALERILEHHTNRLDNARVIGDLRDYLADSSAMGDEHNAALNEMLPADLDRNAQEALITRVRNIGEAPPPDIQAVRGRHENLAEGKHAAQQAMETAETAIADAERRQTTLLEEIQEQEKNAKALRGEIAGLIEEAKKRELTARRGDSDTRALEDEARDLREQARQRTANELTPLNNTINGLKADRRTLRDEINEQTRIRDEQKAEIALIDRAVEWQGKQPGSYSNPLALLVRVQQELDAMPGGRGTRSERDRLNAVMAIVNHHRTENLGPREGAFENNALDSLQKAKRNNEGLFKDLDMNQVARARGVNQMRSAFESIPQVEEEGTNPNHNRMQAVAALSIYARLAAREAAASARRAGELNGRPRMQQAAQELNTLAENIEALQNQYVNQEVKRRRAADPDNTKSDTTLREEVMLEYRQGANDVNVMGADQGFFSNERIEDRLARREQKRKTKVKKREEEVQKLEDEIKLREREAEAARKDKTWVGQKWDEGVERRKSRRERTLERLQGREARRSARDQLAERRRKRRERLLNGMSEEQKAKMQKRGIFVLGGAGAYALGASAMGVLGAAWLTNKAIDMYKDDPEGTKNTAKEVAQATLLTPIWIARHARDAFRKVFPKNEEAANDNVVSEDQLDNVTPLRPPSSGAANDAGPAPVAATG